MTERRSSALRRVGQGALALLAVLTLTGIASEQVARQRATVSFPVPGRLVRVDGNRRIQIDCRGAGSPTVVLESGLDMLGSLSWMSVHDSIARTTRVCAYSRAGLMWSDPATAPFDSRAAARDLRAALASAGEAAPFVLVGHSIGAAYVMRFAADYPAAVAGMVLVDPSHPDQFTEFRQAVGRSLQPSGTIVRMAASLAWTGALRLLPSQNPPAWPTRLNAAATAFLPTSLDAAGAEAVAIPASLANARMLRDFGDRPLVVLSATEASSAAMLHQLGLTPAQGLRIQAVQHRLHGQLASMWRDGRQEFVAHSAHYIQLDQPGAVIRAIESVTRRVRSATP